MKQIAQNYKTGELALLDVPVPTCRPGGVVVRNQFSLVSAGTELMKVAESKLSLAGKARARPDQVRRVLDTAAQQGLMTTYRKVMNRLDSYTPLGYSACGVVAESTVDTLPVGTRVATAGNEFALHAEYNYVPENLCVPVPDEVSGGHAAFATVGSIALHAFRRSEGAIGETTCVIGLGLIGQLIVQIAAAAGLKVVGLDLSKERCDFALEYGADYATAPDQSGLQDLRDYLDMTTGGNGVDSVFLAANAKSDQPVEVAAVLARDRAKVIDVGRMPLNLPWVSYYEKELDMRFSRSYGPGRYDDTYEKDGVDYPIGYVRWTERRNMQSFLELVATGRVRLDGLVSHVVPFDESVSVLEALNAGTMTGIGTLFEYPEATEITREVGELRQTRAARLNTDVLRLGVIGCGNYASTMLVPHLTGRDDVDLVVVATASSLSAATAKDRFDFRRMTTDYSAVLESDDVDAVLVATRHDLHSSIVLEALESGKAVFVEKPLAITESALNDIRDLAKREPLRLTVGFNRRFSPSFRWLRDEWGDRRHPSHVQYTVNAGGLAAGSWYGDTERYGTRFVGEGGHFIDTLSWWLDEDPIDVMAHSTPNDEDDIELFLRYPSGSLGSISYLTNGAQRYPKETLFISGNGKNARMDNFKSAAIWDGDKGPRVRRTRLGVDKGQAGELDGFVKAVLTGDPMPIPIASLLSTTEATLLARESARKGIRLALHSPE